MCGIFGYIGHRKDGAQIVIGGLKLLEYRGYDSWGISLASEARISNIKSQISNPNEKLVVVKNVGKISDANLKSSILNLKSRNVIGHTRWATHGGVTAANAHPHLDCTGKIAVIHNGIIENFANIKLKLEAKGHKFVSETDSEVIAHLIEEGLKTKDFATAVRESFNELSGMNAIVVQNADSSEIIAAKNGSPLVIGQKDGEFFLASDTAGIIKYTNKVLFVKDNEMVILGKNLQLFSLPSGKKLKANFETIDWKIEDVSMGEYSHFMMKEIHEQPKVIANILKTHDKEIEDLAEEIRQAKGTFFIAAGTAYNACLGGIYLFSRIADKHINSAIASEFNYLLDFINKKSLIIALSQSGETIDVVEPLNSAKKKGATIVGITNSLGSTIYRMSDRKLLLNAGPEKAVASTKAYIAKLTILLLLAFEVAGKRKEILPFIEKAVKEIQQMLLPENVERIKKLANKLSSSEHIYVVGRGVSYPTALEAALKIKEVSYIHTEGLAGGELKHGTIALIDKGTPCIVFAPNDETYDAMISNATEIKARGGKIIGVSFKNSSIFDEWIEVKDLNDATFITQIVPIQLLAYFLALKKGSNPDKPRNLAKSVTVK